MQMLAELPASIEVVEVTPQDIPNDVVSIVGHQDTANVVSNMLGRKIEFNRESVTLSKGETIFVAQITGGRLPEGVTELPEGVHMKFMKVTIK